MLETIAIIATIIVSIIAFYRYFIRRPSLDFRIDFTGDIDTGNQVLATFVVENNGHDFAEDTYLNIRLHGWKFGFIDPEKTDIIFNPIPGVSWTENPPEGISEFINSGHQDYEVYINSPIYEGIETEIATRIFELEKNSEYYLEYLIACKSHRPRGGNILIETSEKGKITTSHNPWSRWKRFKYWAQSFRNSSA